MLVLIQAAKTVEVAKKALADDMCVVVGLQSTGESNTRDAVRRNDIEIEDQKFLSAPAEIVKRFIVEVFWADPDDADVWCVRLSICLSIPVYLSISVRRSVCLSVCLAGWLDVCSLAVCVSTFLAFLWLALRQQRPSEYVSRLAAGPSACHQSNAFDSFMCAARDFQHSKHWNGCMHK